MSIPGITHITAIWIVTTAELPGDASNLTGRFKRNSNLCQAFSPGHTNVEREEPTHVKWGPRFLLQISFSYKVLPEIFLMCTTAMFSAVRSHYPPPSFPAAQAPALNTRLDAVLSSSAVSLTSPLWTPDQSGLAGRPSLLMANERCNYSRSAEACRHRGERRWRVHLDH